MVLLMQLHLQVAVRNNQLIKQPSESEESQLSLRRLFSLVKEKLRLARASISIANWTNPSHMSTGSWYANPGDIKIQ